MTNQVIIQQVAPSTVEVQPLAIAGVEINPSDLSSVDVHSEAQTAIELGLTNIGLRGPQGIQGPQGDPGPNEIGGFPVLLADAQEKDILQLKTAAWRNTPQEALTDGGNF